MDRRETLEETAELVAGAGGTAILAPTDHTDRDQVAALAARIAREQDGRLDLLVNNVWGGDHLTDWDPPVLGARPRRRAGDAAQRRLVAPDHRPRARAADGRARERADRRGHRRHRRRIPRRAAYDLVKSSVIRLALAEAADLRPHGVAALAVTPGFLRSEAVLDHFGVTAERWRDAIARDPHFAHSETPRFLGRAVVALAADPAIMDKTGGRYATWDLAREYDFDDVDGARPDWGAHAARRASR